MKLLPKVDLPLNHPYLDNRYTHWYYSIIKSAQQRDSHSQIYGESHHIIPDCFFIKNRSKGKRPGWLEGDPNQSANLVLLTFKEHFICHWLLTKMTTGNAYYQMESALAIFRRVASTQDRVMSAVEYARVRRATSIKNTGSNNPSYGKLWWNNGSQEVKTANCPGSGWVRGRSPVIKCVLHNNINVASGQNNPSYGKYWYTNGVDRIKSDVCPPGWYRKKDLVPYWHNKQQRAQIQTPLKPGPGWVKGQLPDKPHGLKGAKVWIDQEGNQTRSKECPGAGWRMKSKKPKASYMS